VDHESSLGALSAIKINYFSTWMYPSYEDLAAEPHHIDAAENYIRCKL
jgi:hypothetical protein